MKPLTRQLPINKMFWPDKRLKTKRWLNTKKLMQHERKPHSQQEKFLMKKSALLSQLNAQVSKQLTRSTLLELTRWARTVNSPLSKRGSLLRQSKDSSNAGKRKSNRAWFRIVTSRLICYLLTKLLRLKTSKSSQKKSRRKWKTWLRQEKTSKLMKNCAALFHNKHDWLIKQRLLLKKWTGKSNLTPSEIWG